MAKRKAKAKQAVRLGADGEYIYTKVFYIKNRTDALNLVKELTDDLESADAIKARVEGPGIAFLKKELKAFGFHGHNLQRLGGGSKRWLLHVTPVGIFELSGLSLESTTNRSEKIRGWATNHRRATRTRGKRKRRRGKR